MRLKNFAAVLFVFLILAAPLHASGIYDSAPAFSPYYAGAVRADVLYDALDEFNYIRWLIGVPDDVILDSEFTRRAQHGAVLLDAINTITHTPGRPSDMSESFYDLGYDATTHGNIAWFSGGMTLSYSTKMYMDDSDSYNIHALGHRRWMMNPRMTRVGFGISTRRGFAVTYVIDEDAGYTSWPISDEYITWPSRKHLHPLTYFDAGTAWSVTLNSEVFDSASGYSVSVRLVRRSDGMVWNFGASGSDGYFNVNTEGYAYDECIIFRPNNVSSYRDGETWDVYISGLNRKDGTAGSISYSVIFVDEETGYENENENENDLQNEQQNEWQGVGGNDGGRSGGCSSGAGICTFFVENRSSSISLTYSL